MAAPAPKNAGPRPSADEARALATFDALMWAFARPGQPRTLPEPGALPLIEALIDREVSVYATDPALADAAARTGARPAPLNAADYVVLWPAAAPDTLLTAMSDAQRGSDPFPDRGATLILPAEIGRGRTLGLSGPGIDAGDQIAREIRLGGLPDALWAARSAAIRYPMGIDLILIDGATLVALPRSTQTEVL